MADDITLNSMSGGPVVATDDSGTGHVQIVKLAYSADGSRTHVDADANGLKVSAGSVVPGTSATNLGKAEDAPHSSGDTGVAVWGVRNDSLSTTFVGANGDYSPIALNSGGAVYVVAASSGIAVNDNGGSLTVDGSVSITGTPNVNVSNIPSVSQSGSWSVGVTGSVNVNLNDVQTAPIGNVLVVGARDASGLVDNIRTNATGELRVADYSSQSVGSAMPSTVMCVGAQDIVGNVAALKTTTSGALVVGYGATYAGKFISAGATYDETSIYSGTSSVSSIYVSNTGTGVAYVKLWDSSVGTGLIGSSAPIMTLAVPASACQSFEFPQGLDFSSGIAVGFTGGAGDLDTTTVTADEVIANFVYSY